MKHLRENHNTPELWNFQYDKKEIIAQPLQQSKHILIDFIPEDSTLLDVGCGNAKWFQQYTDKGIQIDGVDFSDSVIEQNKTLFPKSNFQCLNFENESIKGVWDYVMSISVFEHLNEPYKIKDRIFCENVKKQMFIVVPLTKKHEEDICHVYQFDENDFPDATDKVVVDECLIARWVK